MIIATQLSFYLNSVSALRIFHSMIHNTVTGVDNGKVEVRGTNIPAIEFNADSNLFLMNHGGS